MRLWSGARDNGCSENKIGATLVSLEHTRQKFWEALGCLIGASPIQDRLAHAALLLVTLAPREVAALPEEIQSRFTAWMDTFERHPAEIPGEGTIHASARKLTSVEGVKLAREVLDIYVTLHGGI